MAASPSTGVNSLTGEGLKRVLTGANVVVDVTNSPSFEDNAVLDFFRSSTGHLLSAAKARLFSLHVDEASSIISKKIEGQQARR